MQEFSVIYANDEQVATTVLWVNAITSLAVRNATQENSSRIVLHVSNGSTDDEEEDDDGNDDDTDNDNNTCNNVFPFPSNISDSISTVS